MIEPHTFDKHLFFVHARLQSCQGQLHETEIGCCIKLWNADILQSIFPINSLATTVE